MTANSQLKIEHAQHLKIIKFLKSKLPLLRREIRKIKAPFGLAEPDDEAREIIKNTSYEYYLLQAVDSLVSRIRTHRRVLSYKVAVQSSYDRYVAPSVHLVGSRARGTFQGRGSAIGTAYRDPLQPVGWVGKNFNVRPTFYKRADLFSSVVDGVTILDVDVVVKMDDYIVAKIIGFTQHRSSGSWTSKPVVGYVAKHVGFGIEAYGESGDARALKTCEQRVLKHIDNKIKGV